MAKYNWSIETKKEILRSKVFLNVIYCDAMEIRQEHLEGFSLFLQWFMRPLDPANVPLPSGFGERGQKRSDISIGGATQTHKVWTHLTHKKEPKQRKQIDHNTYVVT